MGTRLVGLGKALPKLEIENDALQALVDTNDEWIFQRTGIRSRHVAVSESTLELACDAAALALGSAASASDGESAWCEEPIDPASIDLVICATLSADTLIPSAAASIKRVLGLENAVAFDLNAACSGFIYGLSVADSMLAASCALPEGAAKQTMRRALVVGVDRLSRILDWQDRSTCVLFGDGAGAAVVEWDAEAPGIIATCLKTIDDTKNTLTCASIFASNTPFDEQGKLLGDAEDPSYATLCESLEVEPELMKSTVHMAGQSVFRFASRALCSGIEAVLEQSGLTIDDIALIVPHQANERIIRYAAKRLDLDMDRFLVSLAHTGNTSAASVPIALAEAYASGKIKKGDKIIAVAFGAGLTYGALLFEA
ncbi:beta-ketoacyl-ACP synthase 3 [Anaerotardibacter muris]|uniref:beta-ketoacyl-ACP synthase 3 n=1 Tax=Anaerotardibacter muris TaxID=2941505 RepID=UPI0020411A20|nr:beta-ketoacyl-ACP synthase 3 [Anaerotardibacter muris]